MRHFCIYEVNLFTKETLFVEDFGEDYDEADEFKTAMNNFCEPDSGERYVLRCLDESEFKNKDTYCPFINSITVCVQVPSR